MEIVFNKTNKISAICLIAILLISITAPIFAASRLALSSINVGDKLKFTGNGWTVYKSEDAAKNTNRLKVKRYLKKNEEITVKNKNGIILKIADGQYIRYTNSAESLFIKVSSGSSGEFVGPVNFFTLKFYANNGTGSMSDQKITYHVDTPIQSNKFTRSGYKFVGWYAYRNDENKWIAINNKGECAWMTQSEIDKSKTWDYYVYKNGQKVAATTTPGRYVTMWAKWEKSSNVTTDEYTYYNKNISNKTYKTAVKGTKLTSVLSTISNKGIAQNAYSPLRGECWKVSKYHVALLTGKISESNADKTKVLGASITETSHNHYGNTTDFYKRLKSLVDSGKPAVIHVTSSTGSQHWVTVVGYNGNADSFGSFLILDSYRGTLTTGGNGNACSLRKHAASGKTTNYCIRTYN